MNAQNLFADLKARGIVVKIEGNELKLIGRKAALTDDLLATLRKHKAEILQTLRQGATQTAPTDPCPICGGVRFWQRHDGDWICATCHSAPSDDLPEIAILRNLKDALSKAVLEMAEAAGWLPLALDECRSVKTRTQWVAFAHTADVPTLRLAIVKLHEVTVE